MTLNPRMLVVDGYVKAAREELVAGGASMAADQYAAMLKQAHPGTVCDVIFPSDPDCEIPAGAALADYDGVAWTGCSLTVFEDTPEVEGEPKPVLTAQEKELKKAKKVVY